MSDKLSDACTRKLAEAMTCIQEAMEEVATDLAKAEDGTEFALRCHNVDGHLQQALEALEAADSATVEPPVEDAA